MTDFAVFAQKIIDELKKEGRKHTAEARKYSANRLLMFMGDKPAPMDKWDELFVQDYETWLKAQGLSASTIAYYLSQLCAFYKQAVKRGNVQEQDIFRLVKNYTDTQIIIMAGGVGSRFWPMSTPDYPKQFIDVMGVGRSLIQLTVDRLKPICPVENMRVVTNEKYIRIVKEQIPDMPVDNILAEPEARNTAPCIAYACWKIQKKHPAANIVVTPSDALVINTTEYQRVLSKALSYTSDKEAIVTIGIKPSRPETGYGYIAASEPTSVYEIYKVEAFREKPNLETAEHYLAAGNYYWNAGIFVWNIDTISKAICTFQPNLASIMDEMAPSFYTEQEKEVVGKLFPTCEKISIDYAVMEKSKDIFTLPAEFGWSDLGSWGSLRTLLSQDENGNAKVGKDIRLYECKNCVVHAADESKVVVQGLDSYIVAEKHGQLLVCSLREEQSIKEFGK